MQIRSDYCVDALQPPFLLLEKEKKKKGFFIFLLFFRLTPDDEGIDEKKNIFSTVIAVVCLDFFCRGNQVASSSITIYQF